MNLIQSTLNRLENRLQSLIEGSAGRLFPSYDSLRNLARHLISAMLAELQPASDGSMLAPNLYTIFLHPDRTQALQEDQAMLTELAQGLLQTGMEANIRFPSLPVIRVLEDVGLTLQDVHVLAQFSLEHLADTSTLEDRPGSKSDPSRMNAFLIVAGAQIYPVIQSTVNIGRQEDNDLIIDDLRVSRRHAQLRTLKGRCVIFDLGSTGGTFVNGEKVTQCILSPGDVISLAGVPMVFGQDAFHDGGETQQYMSDLPDDDLGNP